jgi:phosphoglycerate dehydrogenase-like enzyme
MAGAEWVQGTDLWEAPHVIVTSARGINARPVAEWAFMAMMAFVKDTRTLFRNQEQGRWERWSLGQLRGKTIGVVGFGAVGHELARLAQAFEMELLLCNRSRPREESLPMRSYFPLSRLRDFLGQCDYVVASVALTKETERLFTEAEFRAMKPSAIFLNVARGGVADESALVQALQQGWIAGAALDVFQQEPLPVDSPLWKMTNVLISPHIAGLFEGYDEAVTRLFCQNLHRYLNGEPLLNVVERGRPL